ncbi:MAG: hypothetical protein LBL90_12685 [Prevotellaceae bacterium]|nr:hypothetical protein [Prevotellaceae bacterium]
MSATESTCQSNGKLTVTVSGTSLANLDLTTAEYQIEPAVIGGYSRVWAQAPGGVLTDVPPGTYYVGIRAYCYLDNEYSVKKSQQTATVTSTYVVPEIYITATKIRPSLNCRASGMIPITISKGLGPYTITITDYPPEYASGAKVFTVAKSGDFEVENLPPGNYKFKVADNCTHTTEEIGASLSTVSSDFDDSNMLYNYICSSIAATTDCKSVRIRHGYNLSSSSLPELHYYLYTKASEYYEWAFLLSNNLAASKTWVSFADATQYLDYTLPVTIKYFRDNNLYIQPYVRLKGTNCEHTLPKINIIGASSTVSYTNFSCETFTVSHKPDAASTYPIYDVFCYPYKWRVLDKDGIVVANWSAPIYDKTTQVLNNVPYGSKIYFEDSEGYTWSYNLITQVPSMALDYNNTWGMDGADEDGYYKNLWYIRLSNAAFPVGTRFEYISGPTVPANTDFVINDERSIVYVFNEAYNVADHVAVRGGTYVFDITFPNCNPIQRTFLISSYRIIEPLSYTLNEEACEGQYITPDGKVAQVNSSGTETPISTYFFIERVNPSAISYDNTRVPEGSRLLLPATGKYTIAIGHASSAHWGAQTLIIDYEKKNVQLNSAVTSAYLCAGEQVGHIRVEGQNGSGNYSYNLIDPEVAANDGIVATNATGYFNYGNAGKTYKVRVNDLGCNSHFEQSVTMIDLNSAQIVYSASTINTFCKGGNIQLNCITLGTTTYTWSGPGITAANQYEQNPLISDPAVISTPGTYTYTVSVTPEHCGQNMIQSINITVVDLPVVPVVANTSLSYCINQSSGSLSSAVGAVAAPGHSLKWYGDDGVSGVNPSLWISTAVAGTFTYYVSQAENGAPYCESSKVAVVIDVASSCFEANDDYASIFSCSATDIDVLANDVIRGGTAGITVTVSGSGNAAPNGATVKYTDNACTNGVDEFSYSICRGGDCATAKVYVTVLSMPRMLMEDACSIQPKLTFDLDYQGMTYAWERSDDGTNWSLLTGETGYKLNISEGGFYRVTITYNGQTLQLPKGVQVIVNRKAVLPGNIPWYDTAYTELDISW